MSQQLTTVSFQRFAYTAQRLPLGLVLSYFFAKLRMAEKPVKEKAAPVAPAIALVVLGVGAAAKNGLSAVIESIEGMPFEMARSSSSSSSSIGKTLDKQQQYWGNLG